MKFYTILRFEKWKLPTLQGDIQKIGDNPHNPHNPRGRSCLGQNVRGRFFFEKNLMM